MINVIGEEKEVLVKYVPVNGYDIVSPLEELENGDYIDLRAAETVAMKPGEFRLISLGVAMQLPKGYYARVVPRSSTFKKYGIIMANSIGIIDESYNGDNDVWKFPAYATRYTVINYNERIAQFTIEEKKKFKIKQVDQLGNTDRGGFGSTGTV